MYIIGIDCGSNGSAVCIIKYEDEKISSIKFTKYDAKSIIEELNRIEVQSEKVLMSVDTPFSWPLNASVLAHHKVGHKIDVDKEKLFKRETDRFVESKIGNQVFSIGADKIARTTYNFYKIIEEIRGNVNKPINFLVGPENTDFSKISVIESYPRATLYGHNLTFEGYKGSSKVEKLSKLKNELVEIHKGIKDGILNISNDHQLDAFICCQAAIDYINGDWCKVPANINFNEISNEGWIFFKEKESN